MITVKEIEEKSMTPEKKAMAKNDMFAFYIGRPLSYVLTIPFLYTNLTPNTISMISIIPEKLRLRTSEIRFAPFVTMRVYILLSESKRDLVYILQSFTTLWRCTVK